MRIHILCGCMATYSYVHITKLRGRTLLDHKVTASQAQSTLGYRLLKHRNFENPFVRSQPELVRAPAMLGDKTWNPYNLFNTDR